MTRVDVVAALQAAIDAVEKASNDGKIGGVVSIPDAERLDQVACWLMDARRQVERGLDGFHGLTIAPPGASTAWPPEALAARFEGLDGAVTALDEARDDRSALGAVPLRFARTNLLRHARAVVQDVERDPMSLAESSGCPEGFLAVFAPFAAAVKAATEMDAALEQLTRALVAHVGGAE